MAGAGDATLIEGTSGRLLDAGQRSGPWVRKICNPQRKSLIVPTKLHSVDNAE